MPEATALDTDLPEVEERDPPVLDHEYDGIREFDNPLPGWWRMIFYGSIVFAVGYWIAYQLDWMKSPDQKYREDKVAYMATLDRDTAEIASSSEEQLIAGAHDSAIVERGQSIFVARCAMCHTPDGHGLVGPNLTDLFQLHGTTRLDLFTTIRDGVPTTAMQAWGPQLPATDVVALASFVSTLRGKNIPGKAPQGQPVPAFAP